MGKNEIADSVVETAVEIEKVFYPTNGNGTRMRRILVIVVLVLIYMGWSWLQNERVVARLSAIEKGQDTLSTQVNFSIDWIKYHQQWSENTMKRMNEDRQRMWRTLNKIEEYTPFDER